MSQEIIELEKTQEITQFNFERVLAPGGAIELANTIKDYAVSQNLVSNIKGKSYPNVEAWQYAGLLLGLFPRVVSVENLSTDKEYKYRAEVEIRKTSGEVVSTGVGVCSNKEGTKKYFEEYAICSMAQTRATGKAFRLLIGWMFKLANLEATPAEEMEEHNPEVKTKGPTAKNVLNEFKAFAIDAILNCSTAGQVEELVNLAPTLKETDSKFIDTARGRFKELSNVSQQS